MEDPQARQIQTPHVAQAAFGGEPKNARNGNAAGPPLPRDEAIREIRRGGRKPSKESVGYHRRSLAETAMYRLRCCCGEKLKNRELENQRTEATLRSKILNHFTHLGLPRFEWS